MRVAVLLSGRGTNLRALIDSCHSAENPANIVSVISNNPEAPGLLLADEKGITTTIIDHKSFSDRGAFESELIEKLEVAETDLVCLAVYMRLLTPIFVNHWHNRLINVHPSLLPAFRGLNTHRRVLELGARFTGCTVHFVRPEMDDGPIIVQAVTAVYPDDTEETLSKRVLLLEHRCYPLALRWIADGKVRVIDERVAIDNTDTDKVWFVNPKPRE